MQLEVADALVGAERAHDARLAAAVRQALALARSTLDEARRSVLDLREAPLDGKTLREALIAFAREAETAAGGVSIQTAVADGADDDLPPAVASGVYRVAQQAVANALQHARAHHIVVHLTRHDDGLHLRVEDDGTGFDPGQVPADRFGLVGMRERAHLLGGTLTVESAPDAGAAIDVRVPVDVRQRQPGDA